MRDVGVRLFPQNLRPENSASNGALEVFVLYDSGLRFQVTAATATLAIRVEGRGSVLIVQT